MQKELKKILPLIIIAALIVVFLGLRTQDTKEAVVTYTNEAGNYSVEHGDIWHAHDVGAGAIIFTSEKDYVEPFTTETTDPFFSIFTTTIPELEGQDAQAAWLNENGLDEEDRFSVLVEREMVEIAGVDMLRIVQNAAGFEEEQILNYIYFPTDLELIAFSHFPYEPDSDVTRQFEATVRSYIPVN